MNRISLHISSLVKHCNSVSKLILLIVLTCCINSVLAQITLSPAEITASKTFAGNAQTKLGEGKGGEGKEYSIKKEGASDVAVTVKGNLTIASETKLEITGGATLVVEGNLTIVGEVIIKGTSGLVVGGDFECNDGVLKVNEDKKDGTGAHVIIEGNLSLNGNSKKSELKVKNNAELIVKKNMTLFQDAKLEISDKAFAVVKGDLKLDDGDGSKDTEIIVNKEAALVVQGKVIIDGKLHDKEDESKTKIKVEDAGSITIAQTISGSGKIEFPKDKKAEKGYFAVLGGLAEGQDLNKLLFDMKGVDKLEATDVGNLIYIKGVEELSVQDKKKELEINASNILSTAFIKATENEASAASLLPIELTSFTASATNNGFVFNWVTASEENNDYFTLEYSIDGVDFNEIDYVHGAGTTSETSEYEYRWDEAPEFDVVYFRLKQTDYNGEYTYSDVIAASRKKSSGANGTFRYGPLNLQIQDGELRYIVK